MKKLFPLIIGLALISHTDAFGLALYFWDSNGTTPGAGGPTPTGTWGVDAFWNDQGDGGGTNATKAWPAGNFAVFAAGNDATGAYTVNVSGVVQVGDIHMDLGQVTFGPANSSGDSLMLKDGDGKGADRLLSVGHKDTNAVARYNVPITTATNIIRYKQGTLIFGATNTFTGMLTIEGGMVQCAVPDTLGATNGLVLGNNDVNRSDFNPVWQFTPAVFHTGGLDQQLGTLNLLGADPTVVRALDLGNGAGTLSFEDSSAQDWTVFTLTITNYALGRSKLRFGTSSTGLTPGQLLQIQFAGFVNLPGVIDASGFVTPALPKVTGITHGAGSVQLAWSAVNARNYRVWAKDKLTDSTWSNLADVPASGDTASYTDSTPSPTGRFYRIEVLP